jgi:glycosyltransferase involved in cell wall biosynthesis
VVSLRRRVRYVRALVNPALSPSQTFVAPAPRPARRLPSLSAFFPVRNEEDNVVPAAEALLRVLPTVAVRSELIIVDDGSVDRTGERADELARQYPGVRVIHHPVGRGSGAALRTGLAAARAEFVFFTDGDRQFDAADLGSLVPHVRDADAVVGYRRLRSDPFPRRLCGIAWNVVVRLLFGLRVRDVNCAFKLFRRAAVGDLRLASEGAAISAELMLELRRAGRHVVEVPVAHYARRAGIPSGGDLRVIGRAFVELGALLRRPASA